MAGTTGTVRRLEVNMSRDGGLHVVYTCTSFTTEPQDRRSPFLSKGTHLNSGQLQVKQNEFPNMQGIPTLIWIIIELLWRLSRVDWTALRRRCQRLSPMVRALESTNARQWHEHLTQ